MAPSRVTSGARSTSAVATMNRSHGSLSNSRLIRVGIGDVDVDWVEVYSGGGHQKAAQFR